MIPPSAVIFDIGNVLITWNPEAFFESIIGARRCRALFASVDLHAMNEQIDAGAPFLATVQDWAAQYPDWATEILHWYSHWHKLAAPPIAGSWDILRALRAQNIPVFALSNIGDETTALAETGPYPQLRDFDRRYISGRIGVTKPNPEIYQFVQDDCGLSGAQIFFTDDRAENLGPAAALGWRTHLFDGPAGLAAALNAQGLAV